MLLLLTIALPAKGQVVDEQSLPAGEIAAVGADSADYMLQSFLADVPLVRQLGLYARTDSAPGAIRMVLLPADTAGQPDLANPLYQSGIITPADTGLTYFSDTTLSILMQLGNKYFLGWQAESGSGGYANAGFSGTYTDTGEDIITTSDNGNSWDTLTSRPLALYVAGETCTAPFLVSASNPNICGNDSVLLEVISPVRDIYWSNGTNLPETWVTTAGTYYVTVVDSNYCTGTDSLVIGQGTVPDPDLDTTYVTCEGRTVGLVPTQGLVAYSWSTGEITSFIDVDSAGVYWVDVVNADGCVARDTAIVILNPNPSPTIGNDTALCDGNFLILDPGGQFTNYLWGGGETVRTISVTTSGDFYVQVTDTLGCVGYSDTVTVTINPQPNTPTISQLNDVLFSSNAFGYQWFFEGTPIPGATSNTYEPDQNGFYSVMIFNAAGCSANSAPIEVLTQVTSDFIPEGFSPNGDGYNDNFRIGQIEFYPDNELVVLNRWGSEVFREQGYRNNWYGQGPDGRIVPSGNYYYVLDLGDGSEPIRGIIFVQR